MGRFEVSESYSQCNSTDGDQRTSLTDFGDMLRVRADRKPNSPPASRSSSISSSPPTTPLTPATPQSAPGTPITPGPAPGTPLGPPTTPANQGLHRHRLPSFTESDSQSSAALESDESQSDSQGDAASVCSSIEWVNFDISPLVKEELKQAIVARRKTQGLPDVEVDFAPRLPDKLTPEEEERRQHQKERNRSAASKCRTKKRHAVGRLVEEAQELETANTQLREEMKALEAERVRLQFLLDMHSPKCMRLGASTVNSGTPITPLPKHTRVSTSTQPTVHSPVSEISSAFAATMTTDAVSSIATMPTPESVSSEYGSSYMPLTPSTTHSQSSTEPSTPALLTPTSVMDAPVFHTTATTTVVSGSVTPPVFHVTSSVVTPDNPQDSGSCNTLSTDVFPFTAAGVQNAFAEATDNAAFPPVVPLTPEVDDDDPLSLSFVKQYLGDDTFLAADLPLPTVVNDTTLSHRDINRPPQIETNLEIVQGSNETSIQDVGSQQLSSSPGERGGNQARTLPANSYAGGDSHLVTSNALQSPYVQSLHPSLSVGPGHAPIFVGASHPTPDTPPTISFSSLLGISFQDLGDAMEDSSTLQLSPTSAICPSLRAVEASQQLDDALFTSIAPQVSGSEVFTTTDDLGRSNTS